MPPCGWQLLVANWSKMALEGISINFIYSQTKKYSDTFNISNIITVYSL